MGGYIYIVQKVLPQKMARLQVGAITIAIISRLCSLNIKNTIALTGEIDLNGNIGQIGGISSKLEGAIKAGVKKVFIPKDNEDDYNKYMNKIKDTMISSDEFSDSDSDNDSNKKKVVDVGLEVVLVSRIEEILNGVYTKKLKFKKIQ